MIIHELELFKESSLSKLLNQAKHLKQTVRGYEGNVNSAAASPKNSTKKNQQ
jgi:hypothetical protein